MLSSSILSRVRYLACRTCCCAAEYSFWAVISSTVFSLRRGTVRWSARNSPGRISPFRGPRDTGPGPIRRPGRPIPRSVTALLQRCPLQIAVVEGDFRLIDGRAVLTVREIGMLSVSPTFSLKRFHIWLPLSKSLFDICPVPTLADRDMEGKNPARALFLPASPPRCPTLPYGSEA